MLYSFFYFDLNFFFANITTKLECPHRCDFCIAHRFFQVKYTPRFTSPKQIYETMVKYRKIIKKKTKF